MRHQNMSDIIEAYLKEVLNKEEKIEIRRSEIAELFDCVPSQINYVINTRFTLQQGYLVESKRGGGGYIRINKIKLLDDSEVIDQLIELVGSKISEKNADSIITKMYEKDIISRREAKIMLVAMAKPLFTGNDEIDYHLRANILKSMLNTLRYEKLKDKKG